MSKAILDKFFENQFTDIRITDSRIYNFSNSSIVAMTAANIGGRFSNIIDFWSATSAAMYAQISNLDTGINIQVGLTKTNNQVMAEFKAKMSDEEGIIAKALGGKNSPKYNEFFPHLLSEYTNATKTQMPFLIKRVVDASQKYETELGKILVDEFVLIQKDWDSSRIKQSTQIATVKGQIATKSKTRTDLENTSQLAILELAKIFAGDPVSAKQFVNTDLLYPLANSVASNIYNGTTDAGAITLVVHDNLSDSSEIVIKITSIGTPVILYVADNDKAQPVGVGKLLNPRKNAYHLTGVELGTQGTGKTYLLINNRSATDKVSWEISVKQ